MEIQWTQNSQNDFEEEGQWRALSPGWQREAEQAWSYCQDPNPQASIRALKVPEWVDIFELAKHKEPALYSENWFHT